MSNLPISKDVAQFISKIIIAVGTDNPEKVASVIYNDLLKGAPEAFVNKYMDEMIYLLHKKGLDEVIEEQTKEAGLFSKKKKPEPPKPKLDWLGRPKKEVPESERPLWGRTVLHAGLYAAPIAAIAASKAKQYLGSKSLKHKIISSSPELMKNKKQAEEFYDTINHYAPALSKAPFVLKNLLVSWMNSGADYVSHTQIEQLIKLQNEYDSKKTTGSKVKDVLSSTESVGNIAKNLGETYSKDNPGKKN